MWIAERAELVQNLDALITARLFGPGKWLCDRESVDAVQDWLFGWGLEEVCGPNGSFRNTALGNELKLDLLMVFLGLWNPWDIVTVLENFELIDKMEASEMYDALAARRDPERLLRRRVQGAYVTYFGSRFGIA